MERLPLYILLNTLLSVHTSADLERQKRRERNFTILILIATMLTAIGSMVKNIADVASHFQHHNWLSLAGDFLPFLLLFLALPSLRTGLKGTPPLPEKVLALRQRLNDEALIQPVDEQPLPLETEELSLTTTRVGPIRRVKGISIFLMGMGLFMLAGAVFLAAMAVTILSSLQEASSSTTDLLAFISLSLLCLGLTIAAVLFLVLAGRVARAHLAVVDEWGLRWQWPHLIGGLSVALAWHEISGIYEITGQENKGDPAKAYVLAGPISTFVWSLPVRSTRQEQQASTYLTRLAVTRTGLPLRDLTPAVEPLLTLSAEPAISFKNISRTIKQALFPKSEDGSILSE